MRIPVIIFAPKVASIYLFLFRNVFRRKMNKINSLFTNAESCVVESSGLVVELLPHTLICTSTPDVLSFV